MIHQALMRGTETWRFIDGEEIVALVAAAVAGLGVALLPDGIIADYITSGALLPLMPNYPPPPAGIEVVRPPASYPAREVRVLTEMLIDCFGQGTDSERWSSDWASPDLLRLAWPDRHKRLQPFNAAAACGGTQRE